ncbi:MAG: hypothetical protein ABI560_12370, partial [Myxococcales bacterium]
MSPPDTAMQRDTSTGTSGSTATISPGSPARATTSGRPRIVFVEPRNDVLHALERLMKQDALRWNLVFVHTFEQAFGAMELLDADVVVASIDPARSDDI